MNTPNVDWYALSPELILLGAALTIILAVFLTFLMLYYLWSIHRAQRDVGAVGAL